MHHVQGGRGIPLEVRRPLLWLVGTATLTVLLDQVSKALVRTSMGPNETIAVIPGLLDIAHVRNTGAAFGMLPGRRELLIAVALIMLISVAVYWWRARPRIWPVVMPLGLVVGGALGNLYDRAVSGQVTDFLSFSFFAPVYNLADSAIVVGVGILIAWVLFGGSREGIAEKEPKPTEAGEDTGHPSASDDGPAGVPS